jgi:alpha-amylase
VLNTHFGTDDELDKMISEGRSAGVSFMLDVVGNHMGGTISDISNFSPFNTSSSYHNCQGCPSSCNIANFQDPYTVQHCRLSGLPDLNQTNPQVATALQSWVKFVVSRFGFAGLRVDTVPEVNKPFWQQFQAAAGTFAVGEVRHCYDTACVEEAFFAHYHDTAVCFIPGIQW